MGFAAAAPIVLGAVSTAATVIGAMNKSSAADTSAAGAQASSGAAAASALYSAQVAKNNQTIALQNADYAEQAGQVRAGLESMKGRIAVGGAKAGQAANDIDVNSGSAVDVREGITKASKFNAETALNNAENVAYGFRTRAVNYGAEAGLDTAQAGFDITGGNLAAQGAELGGQGAVIGAAGSILQNASQLPFGKIGAFFSNNTTPTGIGADAANIGAPG